MITIKSDREIEYMRDAGRVVAESLDLIAENIKVGMSTADLDDLVRDYMYKVGAKPSFEGYQGFPATICTSLNEELVHGIPSPKRILQDGDICSVDIGAIVKGYHGDAARTFAIGNITDEAAKLLQVTEEALMEGIAAATSGARLSDISHAVQREVESNNFSIPREYTGHGIGQELHEDPQVLNYGPPGRGIKLKPGLTLAIEPMVITGDYHVKELDDDWTVVSVDGSLCAHFEHTICIREGQAEILTKR